MAVVDYTKPDPADRLAARIRGVRRAYGLTQPELATESRIYLGRLKDYENGHRPVPFVDLLAIARAVEVDVVAFASGLESDQGELF